MAAHHVTRRQLVPTSFGPLLLLEKCHPPGTVLERHDHPEANFTYVLEGGSRETVQGREYWCAPGSFVYKPGDATHVNHYASQTTRSFVAAWYEGRELAGIERAILFEARGDAAERARRMYAEFRDPDPCSADVLEGLLWELLMGAPPPPRRRPPAWLGRIRDRVVDEYRAGPSLRELARGEGRNPEHVSRLFRAYFGVQVGEYTRRLRVESAARALRSSERPLASIALDAGFSDQSHLTRVFKRLVGTTPSRYRRVRRPVVGPDV